MDVSSQLPELIRRPGITNWSPTVGRTIDTSHSSWEAYIATVPEDKHAESKMLETHWPPSNAGALNLERWCVHGNPLIACISSVTYLPDPACASTRISKTRAGSLSPCWNASRVMGRPRANRQGKPWPICASYARTEASQGNARSTRKTRPFQRAKSSSWRPTSLQTSENRPARRPPGLPPPPKTTPPSSRTNATQPNRGSPTPPSKKCPTRCYRPTTPPS